MAIVFPNEKGKWYASAATYNPYKVTNWCMKLFAEIRAMTDSQIDFNKSLSGASVVVEQAFGLFKGRWRCL